MLSCHFAITEEHVHSRESVKKDSQSNEYIVYSYRARQLKPWVNQRNDVVIKTGFKTDDVVDHIVNLDKTENPPHPNTGK